MECSFPSLLYPWFLRNKIIPNDLKRNHFVFIPLILIRMYLKTVFLVPHPHPPPPRASEQVCVAGPARSVVSTTPVRRDESISGLCSSRSLEKRSRWKKKKAQHVPLPSVHPRTGQTDAHLRSHWAGKPTRRRQTAPIWAASWSKSLSYQRRRGFGVRQSFVWR